LGAQRELYNAALEERIGAWRYEHRSVSRFEQFKALTGWQNPLLEFGVCPARGTLTRLDRAFDGFYRRGRCGEKAGFPRFKSAARWDSVEYPERSCWRIDDERQGVGRVCLKVVGGVRFRGARRGIRGIPKTLTIRREGGRWRVTIFCADVPAQELVPSGAMVGIDVGVRSLAATSDGELIWQSPPPPSCAAPLGGRSAARRRGGIAAPSGASRPPAVSAGCIVRSPTGIAISPTRCRDSWSTAMT